MQTDPSRVTTDQLREALTAMGIDAELTHLVRLTVEPGLITITRKRVDGMGKNFVVSYERLAEETTEIALVVQ